MNPFVDFIQLLRPQATLWSRVETSGAWGLSFQPHDDVLFCWVEQGSCHLIRQGSEPLAMGMNDFVLVRTTVPFALASSDAAKAADSESVITGAVARLGTVSVQIRCCAVASLSLTRRMSNCSRACCQR